MTNTAVTTPPAAAKVWDRESLIALLNTNNYAVERALLTIYARQTADEQETETTSHNNGVGFSGFDAEIFSSFAVQVEQSTRPNGQRLSPKQFAIARKPGKGGTPRIGRYAKQLLAAIEEAGGAVSKQAAPDVLAEQEAETEYERAADRRAATDDFKHARGIAF